MEELTYHQRYYLANKGKFLERSAQYRLQNRARTQAYNAEYFQKVTKAKRAATRKPRVPKPPKPKTVRKFLSKIDVPRNPPPVPLPPPAPCFRWPGVTLTW